MTPINQVILGGDPLLNSSMLGNGLDEQLQLLERYKQNLETMKQLKQQVQPVLKRSIWDEIDMEVSSMTNEQKAVLFNNQEYADLYSKIQEIVQSELLSLVKDKVESSEEGKSLLQEQLKTVKKLKTKITEDLNQEMELFKRFKEYSKSHPEVTYDEFIKTIL